MTFINEVVRQIFGKESQENIELTRIGGGCIHQSGKFSLMGQDYFIKWNANALDMFETEAKGLNILRSSNAIAVPEVLACGSLSDLDFICLDYYEQGPGTSTFWENFGHSLALLHQQSAHEFGLDHNNYIGSLPQSNHQHKDWTDFFINQRLIPQIRQAYDRGYMNKSHLDQFEVLYVHLADLLPIEQPALLHGDLWSGNFLIGSEGQPVIFDPAVYFGHREAELAFTKMFGGFDQRFYKAYNQVFPLQEGHNERVELFNLYPLLVHVNLFGSSYLSGIEATLRRFA